MSMEFMMRMLEKINLTEKGNAVGHCISCFLFKCFKEMYRYTYICGQIKSERHMKKDYAIIRRVQQDYT